MKKVISKKLCFGILSLAFAVCMFFGVTIAKVNASSPITSFNMPGGQIKFADNPAYNGVRFPTLMSDSEYQTNKDKMTTGIILCNADNLGQDGNLTHSTPKIVDIETTDLWKDSSVDGYMEAAAFVYGIPDTTEGYTNKIAAVGYYKITGDANVYYGNTIVRSSAEIAHSAYNDRSDSQEGEYVHYVESDGNYSRFDETQLNGIVSYLPSFTIKYMVDSDQMEIKTVSFGDKAEELVAPDKMGYEFSSWQYNNTDYDFSKGVTENLTLTAKYVEKTYVYGKGFDVTIGVPAFATLTEIKETEGENTGKWYKSLTREISGEGASSFTVTADKDAGLEPNTVYLVSVKIDTDGTHPAYYRDNKEGESALQAKYGDCFYRMAGKSDTVFYVTTDENGEFTKTFDNIWWKNGTCVNFSGLTVMKAAYDKGLQIVNYTGGQTNIVEGIVDSGDGTAIMQLTRNGNNGVTSLYINATTDAGLTPNMSYDVTVSVTTTAKYYHQAQYPQWSMVYASGEINFSITTDANGEFSKHYDTQFTDGEYVKFTDVEVVKTKISAYGTGVDLTLSTTNGITQSEVELNNGTWAKKLTRTNSNNVSIAISANDKAELKANTSYLVTFDIETDANGTGVTLYEVNNLFFLHQTSTSYSFIVTTDSNGTFNKSYSCYFGDATNANYVTFTGITVSESAYGNDVDFGFKSGNGTGVSVSQEDGAYKLVKGGGGGSGAMFITGTKKANTTYNVTITVETDGAYPSFYETNNVFHLNGATPTYTFQITTDENGDFSKTWKTYFNSNGKMSYMKFVSITFEEATA